MADRIVVMYVGKVAEAGPTEAIFERPEHPYTEALLAASPDLEDDASASLQTLEGAIPDPARPPRGCRFHTRCPVATPVCGWEVDDAVRWLEEVDGMFDALAGVSRTDDFDAWLSFESAADADRLAAAVGGDGAPAAMRQALQELTVDENRVRLRFMPVEEIELTRRGPDHVAACVRNQDPS